MHGVFSRRPRVGSVNNVYTMLGHVREVAPLTLRLVVPLLSITLTLLNPLNQWFVMIMKHKDTSKNK